ncbi:hypothetical protein HELRODRAFT_175730 [Helobdella robusta]|uniref:Uncharacterized protein n=1 Tax=Helobdella robusta TaxID=6412 RepID=T1F9L3_HELRO|nr:hypothetical protein HELRODRAFT_175730 [Helobdella robusta]ESO00335.1 hypothetical protein HELRODRAFT_175730 [Helobdella robusta]
MHLRSYVVKVIKPMKEQGDGGFLHSAYLILQLLHAPPKNKQPTQDNNTPVSTYSGTNSKVKTTLENNNSIDVNSDINNQEQHNNNTTTTQQQHNNRTTMITKAARCIMNITTPIRNLTTNNVGTCIPSHQSHNNNETCLLIIPRMFSVADPGGVRALVVLKEFKVST